MTKPKLVEDKTDQALLEHVDYLLKRVDKLEKTVNTNYWVLTGLTLTIYILHGLIGH